MVLALWATNSELQFPAAWDFIENMWTMFAMSYPLSFYLFIYLPSGGRNDTRCFKSWGWEISGKSCLNLILYIVSTVYVFLFIPFASTIAASSVKMAQGTVQLQGCRIIPRPEKRQS